MIPVTPEDVTDTKITVTSTATSLYDLINTASGKGSAQSYYDSRFMDTVMLHPEDGDIRMLFGADPTATQGELFSSGTKQYLPNIQPLCLMCNLRKGTKIINYIDLVLIDN